MAQAMRDRCVMRLEAASSVQVHGTWEMSYDAMATFSPLSHSSQPLTTKEDGKESAPPPSSRPDAAITVDIPEDHPPTPVPPHTIFPPIYSHDPLANALWTLFCLITWDEGSHSQTWSLWLGCWPSLATTVLQVVRIHAVLVTWTCDGRPKQSQMGEDWGKWQWAESAGQGK